MLISTCEVNMLKLAFWNQRVFLSRETCCSMFVTCYSHVNACGHIVANMSQNALSVFLFSIYKTRRWSAERLATSEATRTPSTTSLSSSHRLIPTRTPRSSRASTISGIPARGSPSTSLPRVTVPMSSTRSSTFDVHRRTSFQQHFNNVSTTSLQRLYLLF